MPEYKTTQKFRLSDGFAISHIGEEIITVPISSSTADMGRLTTLNGPALTLNIAEDTYFPHLGQWLNSHLPSVSHAISSAALSF